MARAARGGFARWGIVSLAGLLVLAGLAMTGGPLQGRSERRDMVRLGDLDALLNQADCRAAETGTLAADVGTSDACPATPRRADPFTGAPYRIEVIDARNLRLCAGFEQPQPWLEGRRPDLDARAGGGCIVYRMPDELRHAPEG